MTIKDIPLKCAKKIDYLDLELIIAHALSKSREFVLAHPEFNVKKNQELRIKNYVNRRAKHEPLAYILGHKEFYGLNFKVNKHILIPRPETELLVEKVLSYILTIKPFRHLAILDIGTGSGNIVTTLAKNIKKNKDYKFFAIDNSGKALKVAKKNALIHKVDKKIRFIKSNLLEKISHSAIQPFSHLIIIANLPYLSEKIYAAASTDVKKFEPRTALYSPHEGLLHYKKLLGKIKNILGNERKKQCAIFLEISPEQKNELRRNIKKHFPKAKISFSKDLAGRWRIGQMQI